MAHRRSQLWSLAGLAAVVALAPLAIAQPAAKEAKADPAKKVAVAYLKALEGTGDEAAKEFLLGGATLTAEDFTIPNWKIVERHPPRREVGDIKRAVEGMRALDEAGRGTLSAVVNLEGDEAVATLSKEQAEKILAPTRKKAAEFKKEFPVFAYVARVGKDVFWHPSNPWRHVVEEMGTAGKYKLELHLFRVQETEPGRPPRVWPLRVLRIASKKYDSGWKVLPASDWDPEY